MTGNVCWGRGGVGGWGGGGGGDGWGGVCIYTPVYSDSMAKMMATERVCVCLSVSVSVCVVSL
jgi:hypothetical protein